MNQEAQVMMHMLLSELDSEKMHGMRRDQLRIEMSQATLDSFHADVKRPNLFAIRVVINDDLPLHQANVLTEVRARQW